MRAIVNRLAKWGGWGIFRILTEESPARDHLRGQRGFTLIELLAVIAIIGILAGLVAGTVSGIGETGQQARLSGDKNTLGKAADRFFTESFPQIYPAVSLTDTDDSLEPAFDSRLGTDLGVRLIDFEATLPQDVTRAFVPDFLKEVPDSAGLVSWRIDTNTGNAFFTEDGAFLARPSTARLDVKAGSIRGTVPPFTSKETGERSDYTITLEMKKGDAAVEVIEIAIPTGYIIGGQSLSATTQVGTLDITFGPDNPWDPAATINVDQVNVEVVSTNQWKAVVTYDNNDTTAEVKEGSAVEQEGTPVPIADVRTHTISIIPPVGDSPGKLTLIMDRSNEDGNGDVTYTDSDANEATETFTLILFGEAAGSQVLIQNPVTPAVFRWLSEQQTAVDVEGTFKRVAGNQAVIIKLAPAS